MKHVRTLVNGQQRRTPAGAPRSGGRTAARGDGETAVRVGTAARGVGRGTEVELPVQGSMALQARRRAETAPAVTPGVGEPEGAGLRVAPPAPVRAPRAPFVVLVLGIVIAGVVGILVLNTKINTNQFELYKLQQEQKSLDIQQDQLEKEIAQQEAPGTLAGQAPGYNMKPPSKPPTFIVLPDDRKLGVPQPAVGK